MAGTHLYHSYLMFFIQSEQSFWHTHIVIEVALGIQHIEFLTQDGCDEFLGCCFSVSTCNTYDRDVELATVLACNIFKSLQAVVYQYQLRRVSSRHIFIIYVFVVNDGVGAALLKRLYSELITIERRTFECNKDTSLGTITTVSGYTWMFLIKTIERFYIHNSKVVYNAEIAFSYLI